MTVDSEISNVVDALSVWSVPSYRAVAAALVDGGGRNLDCRSPSASSIVDMNESVGGGISILFLSVPLNMLNIFFSFVVVLKLIAAENLISVKPE